MRRRSAALLAVMLVFLAACGLPSRKDPETPVKVAVTTSEAESVFERHIDTRSTAYKLLDANLLTAVEAGPLLEIDAGEIAVRSQLGKKERNGAVSGTNATMTDVYAPRFHEYPLWFLAVVRDDDSGLMRLQVFSRQAAARPWVLVASPEARSADAIPELALDAHDAPEILPVNARSALVGSPQSVAETYAEALQNPGSESATQIGDDTFIDQVRSVDAEISALKGVTYEQTWKPHDVKHAVRTADGGALVFATFTREEKYQIKDGVTVDWPDGSPQKAFLGGDLQARGKLRYNHQVLLYVPAEGEGQPRAVGQYGGIIDGDGY